MFQSTETGKQKQLFPSTEVLHGVVLIIIVWSIFFCRDFPGTGKGLPRSSRGFVESTSSSVLVGIFHDLGLQVVLVAENVALPLDNFLLFANPDFFCNLENKQIILGFQKKLNVRLCCSEDQNSGIVWCFKGGQPSGFRRFRIQTTLDTSKNEHAPDPNAGR